MYFNGRQLNKDDYCKCKNRRSVTAVEDEWGYWDVCCSCNKPIEGGFHYYNHYDGEDHEDCYE